MKAWLARAVSSTARRGEDPRNRITRWSRWFPPTPTVDASAFQGPGDPYPRHWRRFPVSWTATRADDPVIRDELRDVVAGLPDAWREVVQRRDVQGQSADDVSRELRITGAQQRQMLNRARALLRSRLASRLAGDGRR